MCGIYGVVRLDGGLVVEELERSAELIAHRGPDDSGTWVAIDGRAGFAHRRLAILDPSSGGHQPMTSRDGRAAIVYNGEIYNYRDLRRQLENLGFAFASSSDTEVVLTAYLAWGESFLDRLNGMFAFAIFDGLRDDRAASVFFARDRIGEKPFYYSLEEGVFRFSSELKALRGRAGLDLDALNFYLALGYVPADRCLMSGVAKLPAGFAGRLRVDDLKVSTWRYWRAPKYDASLRLATSELLSEALRLLEDSVRLRLQGDVPLGVLLSGGMDSSIVTALAARNAHGRIKTFTVGLPGSDLDESAKAATLAGHFGTDHATLELTRPPSELLDELRPRIDEPIADSSIIPMYGISKLTRAHVTVALAGDGGDEVFGGYDHYAQTLYDLDRLGWIPAAVLRVAARHALSLPGGVKGRNRVASLRAGVLQQSIWGTPYFDSTSRLRLLGGDVVKLLKFGLEGPERWRLGILAEGVGAVDALTRMDLESTLAEGYLTKVDRASMAVSLEVRCPILDHRLVELFFSRASDVDRATASQTRILERQLAAKLLPPGTSFERKQGFSVPMDSWLRSSGPSALGDYREGLPSVIGRGEVLSLEKGHSVGRANGARLFSLVMLAIAARNCGWA